MSTLAGKTLLITGASRGIGKAIALRAARDGANIAIAAKTTTPHPKLPGTIYTAADEITAAGGTALPIACDLRDADAVAAAAATTVDRFGGLDILVNNASAISLTPVAETPVKRFDLMMAVNTRGTFVASQAALEPLRRAANPHILMIAPPPNLDPRWFGPHTAYTIAKYGMSLIALGLAEELRRDGIAVNALWPRTVIATAAIAMLGGAVAPETCRTPEIVADAAHLILTGDARSATGRFLIDEDVLAAAGVTDFDRYAVEVGRALTPDLFLD